MWWWMACAMDAGGWRHDTMAVALSYIIDLFYLLHDKISTGYIDYMQPCAVLASKARCQDPKYQNDSYPHFGSQYSSTHGSVQFAARTATEWDFRHVRQVSSSGWGFPHAFSMAFMQTTSAGVTWQKLSSSAMLQPAAPVASQFFAMHCLHASGSCLSFAQVAVCTRRHLSDAGVGAGVGWQYSCSQLRVQFALRIPAACLRTHATQVVGSGWDGAGCGRLQLRSSSSMHATSSGVTLQKCSLRVVEC